MQLCVWENERQGRLVALESIYVFARLSSGLGRQAESEQPHRQSRCIIRTIPMAQHIALRLSEYVSILFEVY